MVSMRSVTCHSLSSVPDTILWLRRDLRLADHPALVAAHEAASGGSVLPLFVLDPTLWASAGPARRAWLTASLRSLSEQYDGALVIRHGSPAEVLPRLAREVGAASVHISAESTPFGRRRDERVREALGREDVTLEAAGTPYAVGPGTLTTGGGTPYQVFTPFARAWRAHGWPRPAAVPGDLRWVRRVGLRGPARGRRRRARPAARRRAGRARALARVPRRGHRGLRRAP